MSEHVFDVLVIGGGHSGLAFVRLLETLLGVERAGLSIAVVDVAPAPSATPPDEVGLRVVAISPTSRRLLEHCGAWQLMPRERLGPYERMVVWQHQGAPGAKRSITFDVADLGVEELGYIVENDLLRQALWHAPDGQAELFPETVPAALAMDDDEAALKLVDGRVFRTRLVVAADGHASWLRDALGIGVSRHPYGQHAVVAHLACAKPHRETAWQRFLADGPLALLPLADGRASLVWSCPSERAQALLGLDDAAFAAEVTAASDGVLGELRCTGPRAAFELVAKTAERCAGPRFALIGDAAHRIHPLAGQGVNLGFKDAISLAEHLAEHLRVRGADPGDLRVLRAFERSRRSENAMVSHSMTLLNAAFSSDMPAVAASAGRGLALVDRLGPVKRLLTTVALGRCGDLPAWARGDG